LDATESLHKELEKFLADNNLIGRHSVSPKPKIKRFRQDYEPIRSFVSMEEFKPWWEETGSEGLLRNATYSNVAGETIDIYQWVLYSKIRINSLLFSCKRKGCYYRLRTVLNPTTGAITVEQTTNGHCQEAHQNDSLLNRQVKDAISELFGAGMKPKAIRVRLLVSLR
jgi:hypothetical protein